MKQTLLPLIVLCVCVIMAAENAEAYQTWATVVNVQPIKETVYEPVTHSVCTDPDKTLREFTEVSATIGEDIRRQNRLWQKLRSCRIITEKQARERVTAYRVTYRYRGYTSTTQLSYHPGNRMPVNISLSPLP
jgi:uncharacterized protein YcfJ